MIELKEDDNWSHFRKKIKSEFSEDVIKKIGQEWKEDLTEDEDFKSIIVKLCNHCSEIIDEEESLELIPALKFPIIDYESQKKFYDDLILNILTARFVKFLSNMSFYLTDHVHYTTISRFIRFLRNPEFRNIYYTSVVFVISRVFLDNDYEIIPRAILYLDTTPQELLDESIEEEIQKKYENNIEDKLHLKDSIIESVTSLKDYNSVLYQTFLYASDFFNNVVINSEIYRSVIQAIIDGFNKNNPEIILNDFISSIDIKKIKCVDDSKYFGLCGLNGIYLDLNNICVEADYNFAMSVASILGVIIHEL